MVVFFWEQDKGRSTLRMLPGCAALQRVVLAQEGAEQQVRDKTHMKPALRDWQIASWRGSAMLRGR